MYTDTVHKLYDRTDIYPTLQMLNTVEGKIDIKFRPNAVLIFLKVNIPDDVAERLVMYCARLRNNKMSKGKLTVDKIRAQDKAMFVGCIKIHKVSMIGQIVNPFTRRFLRVYRQAMNNELALEDTDVRESSHNSVEWE